MKDNIVTDFLIDQQCSRRMIVQLDPERDRIWPIGVAVGTGGYPPKQVLSLTKELALMLAQQLTAAAMKLPDVKPREGTEYPGLILP